METLAWLRPMEPQSFFRASVQVIVMIRNQILKSRQVAATAKEGTASWYLLQEIVEKLMMENAKQDLSFAAESMIQFADVMERPTGTNAKRESKGFPSLLMVNVLS
jgi:hypothetical protein